MPDSAVYCSLAERAYTDLITNATQFAGFDLEEDIKRMLVPGGFPREALPSMLHESVHHWCFMTPVGTALALLSTRARMGSLTWALTNDDSVAMDAFDDHLRFEATTLVLRPLAEGLAQFFEYDVMPYPATPVASHPSLWMYHLFGRPTVEEVESNWGVSLLQVLGEMRVSAAMIRRKTNLLCQPLHCRAGGYLPGYLAVKNLWRKCRERHDAFYDADLFAMLLRHYVYRDYGFVNFILDKSVSGPEWLVGVVDYLGYRLAALTKTDLESAEKLLLAEQELDPLRGIDDAGVPGAGLLIDVDAELASEGLGRIQDLHASIRSSLDDSPLAETAEHAVNFQLMPLAFRHLLWLGGLEVTLSPSSAGKVRVSIASGPLLEAELVDGDAELPDSGVLDLYVSVFETYIGATISSGSSVIATYMQGAADNESVERFRELAGDREQAEGLEGSLRTAYRKLEETFEIRKLHDKLLAHVQESLENVYRPGVLLSVPRESHASVLELMKDDGLLPVVDGDVGLLRSAAALSLAAALRMHPEEVESEIESFEGSVEDVLAALDGHSTEKDFPMVFGKEGYELGSYV